MAHKTSTGGRKMRKKGDWKALALGRARRGWDVLPREYTVFCEHGSPRATCQARHG